MSAIEFQPWPKIARLNREIVVTEKIDGTNAAIGVTEDGEVYAQSRTRIITPDQDNFGFAGWVHRNAPDLRDTLGVGLHFGEWWGQGIQRGYGLTQKVFSLFNAARWADALPQWEGLGFALRVVPVLYEGPYDQSAILATLSRLRDHGSVAAPGYMKPEGIVVYHTAAKTMFKVTLEKDEAPKGAAA